MCTSSTFPSTIGLSLWMNRLTLGQNASLITVWKYCSGISHLKLTISNVATSTPFLTKGLQIMVAVSTPSLFATYSHTESDFTCALNISIWRKLLLGTTSSSSQLGAWPTICLLFLWFFAWILAAVETGARGAGLHGLLDDQLQKLEAMVSPLFYDDLHWYVNGRIGKSLQKHRV